MSIISFKSFLIAFLCTIGLVITQQASAKIYTFEGQTTLIGSTDPTQAGVPIGGAFTITLDVSNPPDNEGREFAFAYTPPEFDASSIITFDTGQVFSSSMSRISAHGPNVRYSLLNPILDDESFSNLSIELAGHRFPSATNFDFLMVALDNLIISGIDSGTVYEKISLVSVVPEPSSYALLLTGLGLLFLAKRKSLSQSPRTGGSK